MESLPLNPTCQGRCEVNTLSSDMKYCFEKSLCSDSYTLVISTVVFPLLLLGVVETNVSQATKGNVGKESDKWTLVCYTRQADFGKECSKLQSVRPAVSQCSCGILLGSQKLCVTICQVLKFSGSSAFSMTSKFERSNYKFIVYSFSIVARQ